MTLLEMNLVVTSRKNLTIVLSWGDKIEPAKDDEAHKVAEHFTETYIEEQRMIPNKTPIIVAFEIGDKYSLDNTISVDTDKTDLPNQAGYALEEATDIMKEEIKSGRNKSAVSIMTRHTR